MPELEIPVKHLRCLRCGYVWIPKVIHPVTCPSCHSPSWDKNRPDDTLTYCPKCGYSPCQCETSLPNQPHEILQPKG